MIPLPSDEGERDRWRRLNDWHELCGDQTSEANVALILSPQILFPGARRSTPGGDADRWVITNDGWCLQRPETNAILEKFAAHPGVYPVWVRPEPALTGYGFAGDRWEAIEPDGPIACRGKAPFGWWPHHAVLRWLRLTPLHLDTVIWIDPDLQLPKLWDVHYGTPVGDGETSPTLTHGDVAAVALHDLGMRQLLISPDPSGLAAEDVETIEGFLDHPGPPTPPRLPEVPGLPNPIDWYEGDVANAIICAECDPNQWWLAHYAEVYACPKCGRQWCADLLLG